MNSWVIENISFPLWQKKNRLQVSKHLRDLENSQWYTPERLEELQWVKLNKMLQHCYKNIPYYRHLFEHLNLRPGDFKSPEDLHKIPVLTKTDLQKNFKQMRAMDGPRPYIVRTTSGTVGTPSVTYIHKQALSFQTATQIRGRSWWDWNVGDKYVSLRGRSVYEKNPIRKFRDHVIDNRKVLSVFNLTKETVKNHFSVLEQFRPKFLYAWSNGIYSLAKLFKENNLDPTPIKMKGICTTAEILYDYQRKLIESVFGCPVINEYGCAEVGVIAFQCPRGGMHISSENVFVEFIHHKNKDYPDGLREIIVTDLNNFVMPLLRYHTGDLGNRNTHLCSCGRGLPLMSLSIGRELDMVMLKNGKLVHPAIVPFMIGGAIKQYGNKIRRFKVVQKAIENFLMTVSVEAGFETEARRYFRNAFRRHLGNEVKVDFEFVDQIPREKSGKFREFVSEVTRT